MNRLIHVLDVLERLRLGVIIRVVGLAGIKLSFSCKPLDSRCLEWLLRRMSIYVKVYLQETIIVGLTQGYRYSGYLHREIPMFERLSADILTI